MTLLDWANSEGSQVGDWITTARRHGRSITTWARHVDNPDAFVAILMPTTLHRDMAVALVLRGHEEPVLKSTTPSAPAEPIAASASRLLVDMESAQPKEKP